MTPWARKKSTLHRTHRRSTQPESVSQASTLRSRWLRLLLAIGVPLFFLLTIEGVLRLAGYGYPTSFFLKREIHGRPMWVDNWQFGWRFFPRAIARMPYPFAIPREKAPGTTRVFVFGESAALGVPAPEYGFSRMLEVLLSERFPGRAFEVVNVSMVAINSHAIVRIAEECARRQGDLWVVYMGNNEVIGPFGPHGVIGSKVPPLPLIQANLALKQLRVGQLMDAMSQSLGKSVDQTEWHGMKMWKDHIPRSDPRIAQVHTNFQRNLTALLEVGHRAGVPILLSTVACNLRDCPPFASLHSPSLNPSEQSAWQQAFDAGTAREAEGKFAEAFTHFQSALKLDPHHAELQFRLARCALALGQTADAQRHFQAARDEDALQFRTDSRLNEIIRATATAHASRGVKLLDAESMFARQSPDGIPGAEWFWEHVHLTFSGNYLLAKALAEQIAGMSADAAKETNTPPWMSQADCERECGLTDWGRQQAVQWVQNLISDLPFTAQLNHSNQVELLRAELRRLQPMTRSAGVRNSVRQLQTLVGRHPGDPERLKILAELLEAAGDFKAAEQRWREITELLPQASVPFLNLARVIERQNRPDDAVLAYSECLRRNPFTTDALGDLGKLYLRLGRPDNALPLLQRLIERQPQSAAAHHLLGQALWQTSHQTDAVAHFQTVVRLDPKHEEARRYLDGNPPVK